MAYEKKIGANLVLVIMLSIPQISPEPCLRSASSACLVVIQLVHCSGPVATQELSSNTTPAITKAASLVVPNRKGEPTLNPMLQPQLVCNCRIRRKLQPYEAWKL